MQEQNIDMKKTIWSRYGYSYEDFQKLEQLRGCPIKFFNDNANIDFDEFCSDELRNRTPLVTIWMLTYNHEKFIEEAIEGVVNQKCDFPIELVIVEDYSSDNTLKICKKYQSLYPDIIHLFSPKERKPFILARLLQTPKYINKVFRGEYLAFCEGDDYWCDETKLQKQVEVFKMFSDVGVVFGGGYILKNNGEKELYKMEQYDKNKEAEREYIYRILNRGYITNTIMCRCSAYKEFNEQGLFSKFWLGQGDCTWLSDVLLRQNWKMFNMPDPICVYRLHDGSITQSKSWIDAKRDAYMVNTIAFMGFENALNSRVFRRNMLSYAMTHATLHLNKREILRIIKDSFIMLVPLKIRSYFRAFYALIK